MKKKPIDLEPLDLVLDASKALKFELTGSSRVGGEVHLYNADCAVLVRPFSDPAVYGSLQQLLDDNGIDARSLAPTDDFATQAEHMLRAVEAYGVWRAESGEKSW